MRIPKRGEKGFTLIELLIVAAILGVLAAVVIPAVQGFIGAGEKEAKDTELASIQAAVSAMMVQNELSTLTNPVTSSVNTMGAFPDTSTITSGDKAKDVLGTSYVDAADKDGYILYQHDRIAGDAQASLTNYVASTTTAYWYTVDSSGTVKQFDAAGQS